MFVIVVICRQRHVFTRLSQCIPTSFYIDQCFCAFFAEHAETVQIILANTSLNFVRTKRPIIIISIRGNSQQRQPKALMQLQQLDYPSAVVTDKPSQSHG